jgi:hypothetical protein
MTEADDSAYDRGHLAGRIDARLADHDKHFATINGSIADVAKALSALTMAVQRLGDQAVSDAATRITTAAALKDADAARRDKSEQSWSPLQKVMTTLGALATVAGTVAVYISLTGK